MLTHVVRKPLFAILFSLGASGGALMGIVPSIEPVYEWQTGPFNPMSRLVEGTGGDFYGTSFSGGKHRVGTVFKVSPTGDVTTLVSFGDENSAARGINPIAGLTLGLDGNFYGLTYRGGANDYGTAFRMTPEGAITTLADFNRFGPEHTGAAPTATMVRGNDGNFYGTTTRGGSFGNVPGDPQQTGFGTVFRMTPAGDITVIVHFTGVGGKNKGKYPMEALVLGRDGNFYGTTHNGGVNDIGTVFKVTPAGVLTTLVEFTFSPAMGSYPRSSLAEGENGVFYGSTYLGGPGFGTIFKVTSAGAFTTLAVFDGSDSGKRGLTPQGSLVKGADGNFYGTTIAGGKSLLGTVFRVTPAGEMTTLADFTGRAGAKPGSAPQAGLVLGSDGDFRGTTGHGVFRISPGGVFSHIASMADGVDGMVPLAPLVQDGNGDFYGTTSAGGTHGRGTVFRVSPSGEHVRLLSFTGKGGANRGRFPTAGLTKGADGNFYGTTSKGGAHRQGTVFRVTPSGALTVLVDFAGDALGGEPRAGLILGGDGNFYGTTHKGGANQLGTVFRMTPAGTATPLLSFTGTGGTHRGANPQASLLLGSDGNFYGTTYFGGTGNGGTVFRMSHSGEFTTLVDFDGIHGRAPAAALIEGEDGHFYGTAMYGGSGEAGTVFRMSPAGMVTSVFSFDADKPGKGTYPQFPLLLGHDGNLYGTTVFGGINDCGVAFRLTTDGALSVLGHFAPPPDKRGTHPQAALVAGPDNHLYGTTGRFTGSAGTVFRIRFGPKPLTGGVHSVAGDGAVLNASVNPRGLPTEVSFEYGTSPSLAGAETVSAGTIPAGNRQQAVSAPIDGLAAGKTYYYRAVARNAENPLPQYGEVRKFRGASGVLPQTGP